MMAWVEQCGSRSWRVRYVDGEGHLRSVSGFGSVEQAQDYIISMTTNRQRGVWVDPAAGQITLLDWTWRWLPTLTVAERTEENYRRDLRKHVLPRWGEYPLGGISAGEINAWAAELLAAGYAPATVSSLVKLLSRLLTDAVEARLIGENPVRRHRRRGPRVLPPTGERVWATPEQVVQIAEHAIALGDPGGTHEMKRRAAGQRVHEAAHGALRDSPVGCSHDASHIADTGSSGRARPHQRFACGLSRLNVGRRCHAASAHERDRRGQQQQRDAQRHHGNPIKRERVR